MVISTLHRRPLLVLMFSVIVVLAVFSAVNLIRSSVAFEVPVSNYHGSSNTGDYQAFRIGSDAGVLSRTPTAEYPADFREVLVRQAREAELSLKKKLRTPSLSETRTTRGIMVFLPYNSTKFEKELKSIYLSVGIMRTSQSDNIKTDILVFTPDGGALFAGSLGCVKARRGSFDDPERCLIYQHVPLKERAESNDPLKSYAAYVDSMLVLAEFTDTHRYDLLMRADLDTFVTPGFANWSLPAGIALASGHGAFGSPNAFKRLEWIATQKLGLSHQGLRNVGSTWYGYSDVMVAGARLTLAVMRWLETQEFSEYEKYHSGNDGYPHWHYPIMLLYAGNIAMNQIPSDRIMAYVKGQRIVEMDYRSDFAEALTLDIKHLHSWHTSDFFSKFKFQAGEYTHLDLSPYVDMNTCQAYAGMIAISSDRLTVDEIRNYINNPESLRSGDWVRASPKP